MVQRVGRLLLSLAAVAVLTFAALRMIPRNATTVGFVYLLLVLVIASTWGFIEAALASVAASLAFNFFFLEPVGSFTIADPENYVAFLSLVTTSLIGSRLSAIAKRRALDAVERQQDIERLYTFSRAILLIDSAEPFAKQLLQKLAETFGLEAATLYERRTGEIFRAGPNDFEGPDDQLREAALQGASYTDAERKLAISAVRLGSQPIASLGLQGSLIPDSVLQGLANLVAIGLERARVQDLSHQMEAARQSDQLRMTLIDAMAHEFKTPLTSIKAATTSLLADADQPRAARTELLRIADEEADRLRELIDDSIEMARLDTDQIAVHPEIEDANELVRGAIASLRTEIDDRPVDVVTAGTVMPVAVDRKLITLAFKQVLDNALKYSPPRAPVTVRVKNTADTVTVEITDRGNGIPLAEQGRIFDRFYRSSSVRDQVPGSGLGLSIAHNIVRAHGGELTVSSIPGETTFQLTLPVKQKGRVE